MMQRSISADDGPLVSRSSARLKIREAIRLYVGRGRRYSVKQLSNATGIADRVIECAMADPDDGDFRPLPLEALLSISAFLGPEFTTEWLKLSDQGAYLLPDSDETPPGVLAADNSEDNARVVRAAADGVFDGPEIQVLRPVGLRMMARGAQLAALKSVA